ncbi:hypothetical protein LCGC14_0142640 [marine sediment metagenome]|uniref:DUF3150 domain-containing protein n=1 Tax=marine sediment metagenome TaxID=412755 RepID=A0A0F9V4V2_9ZZZZ
MTTTDKNTINLFELGTLVNLKIGVWSGRKMLTRADLVKMGYENQENLPSDIVNLGRKLMVPKEELQAFDQISQKARKILEQWSIPFCVASAHFVPNNILTTVEQQLKDLKEEFFNRVDSFMVRFDDTVGKIKEDHPDFWEKCLKGNYPASTKHLRKRYKFDWYLFQIAGIGSIQETTVEEVSAKQKIQIEREKELRQQMQKEVEKFVGEYVAAMRQETIEFCDMMTARVSGQPYKDEEKSKKLTARSITSYRKYVDRFRKMNIFEDQDIEKMLTEFSEMFLDSTASPEDFESTTVQDGVTNALNSIRQKAAAEGENAGGFLGELKRRIIL